MAHVKNDRLLVKKFPDVPVDAYAPGEAEIELYANPDGSYIEIEQQGAYTTLAPGSSITYEVVFYTRKLSQALVSTERGNAGLVKTVNEIIK
jgi:hypothetical protein